MKTSVNCLFKYIQPPRKNRPSAKNSSSHATPSSPTILTTDNTGLNVGAIAKVNTFLQSTSQEELDLTSCGINTIKDLVMKTLATTGRLKTLDLEGNNLKTLPASIGELKELIALNAYGNQLTALPAKISHCKHLKILYLGENKLKKLPVSIGELKELKDLDAHGNQLTALPDKVSHCKQLENLYLGENKLKKLPASIGDLSQLKTLDLQHNQLQELPDSIGSLSQLETLNLQHNQLRELPATTRNLPMLKREAHTEFKSMIRENFLVESILRLLYGKAFHLNYFGRPIDECQIIPPPDWLKEILPPTIKDPYKYLRDFFNNPKAFTLTYDVLYEDDFVYYGFQLHKASTCDEEEAESSTAKPYISTNTQGCNSSETVTPPSSPLLPKYDLIDVKKDGNCFYRALYHAIKNDEAQSKKIDLTDLSEEGFVTKIRKEASEAAVCNKDTYFTGIIKNLYDGNRPGEITQEIIDTIATDGKWEGLAGDAAVSIVQQFMKNTYDIEIDIFLPGQTDPHGRIGNVSCLLRSGDHYKVMVPEELRV